MTQHNLGDHLSWFLQTRPLPPQSVNTVTFDTPPHDDSSTRHIDQPLTSDASATLPPSVIVGVTREAVFTRPPLPPAPRGSYSNASSVPDSSSTSMARLATSSRSKRPQLLSQHQLATPTPTNASSSLTATYAKSLTANAVQVSSITTTPTPYTKSLPSSKTVRIISRDDRRPLTPLHNQQTPVVEVDLTGDNASSSPSYGESKTLWTPSAAASPGPRGKKRKSNDLDTVGRREKSFGKSDTLSLKSGVHEDFFDIDDPMSVDDVPAHPPPPYSTMRTEHQDSRTEPRTSSERADGMILHDSHETFSRSYVEVDPYNPLPSSQQSFSRREITRSQKFRESSVVSKAAVESKDVARHTGSTVVATSSSATRRSTSPTSHVLTKLQGTQENATIKDSEDEESMTDYSSAEDTLQPISNAACNNIHQRSYRNDSAKILEYTSTPNASSKSTIGNAKEPPDTPQARRTLQSSSSNQLTSMSTSADPASSATFDKDDTELLQICLADPTQLTSTINTLEHLITSHATTLTNLIDVDAPCDFAKKALEDSRRRKSKLQSLYDFRDTHSQLVAAHAVLKKESLKRMINGEDYEQQEQAQKQSARSIRAVEQQIVHILRETDALELGFGSYRHNDSAPIEAAAAPIDVPASSAASLVRPEKQLSNRPNISFGQSTQVVLQTQMPSQSNTGIRPFAKFRSGSEDRQGSTYKSSIKEASTKHTGRQQSYKATTQEFDDEFPDGFDEEDEMLLQEASARNEYMADQVNEEDFGDSADDDDMCEVVAHAETAVYRPPLSQTQARQRELQSHTIDSRHPKEIVTTKFSDMYSISKVKDGLKLPWSRDVKVALKDRFKLSGFRQNQLDAINATLGGDDVFVLMPTGGGKSLCYQLPALVDSGRTRGVTVVVSPLLSLMQDQLVHLDKMGIPSAQLTSEMDISQKRLVYSGLREQQPEQFIRLLYVTPEALNQSDQLINALLNLYNRNKLARIVIDEAHCVSQWGHDFRQDYKALGELREKFPGVPFMALTATATENCKMDVMHCLGMDSCKVFTQSFNRPNLTYEVRPKGKKSEMMQNIADLIHAKYKGQSGIIYALARKTCETVARELSEEWGIRAHHYHAGMEPEEKSRIQKEWQQGKYSVIVATIAFGMGIDKANVRYVIHHSLPKSLEGYYQETGRAGRDGRKSGCYLFYGYQDVIPLLSFIDKDESSGFEQKQRQRKMLQRMKAFCENNGACRRVEILSYFNERFAKADCNHSCDNCQSTSTLQTVDYTDVAKKALQIVLEINSKKTEITVAQCAELLTKPPTRDPGKGYKTKTLAEKLKIENMRDLGSVTHLFKADVEQILYRLIAENALHEYNKLNKAKFPTSYIELGDKYGDILKNRRPFKMQIRTTAKSASEPRVVRSKKATSSTGVVATSRRNEHPQSTNVSSPVHRSSTTKRNHQKSLRRAFQEEEDIDVGESDDSFIDDEDVHDAVDDEDGDEDEDVGFESVTIRSTPRMNTRGKSVSTIGPPITNDSLLDEMQLPDIHRSLLDDFVRQAKKITSDIQANKDLRNNLFTDKNLRYMAGRWTEDLGEMSAIPKINQENVRKYGKHLIPLIKRVHGNYEQMMAEQENRDLDGNHQNVIEIGSDDEDDAGEPSAYFDTDKANVQHVNDFHKALNSARERSPAYSETQPTVSRADTPPPRPSASASRSRGGSRGGGKFSGTQRRKSGTGGEDGTKARSRAPSGSSSRASGPTKSKSTKRGGEGFAASKNGSMQQFLAPKTSGSRPGGHNSSNTGNFSAMPY